jgi:hypothetical protein
VRCGGSNLNLVWHDKSDATQVHNLPDVLLGIPCTNTRPSQVTTHAANVEITCHRRDTLAPPDLGRGNLPDAVHGGAYRTCSQNDVLTGGAHQTVRAACVLGCEGAGSPTRSAIGSRYVGDSDARPNFNIVFRVPGLAERVPHGPAIHWVINPDTPGLVGRMDLADTWWTIAMGDADTGQRDPRRLILGLIGGDPRCRDRRHVDGSLDRAHAVG